MDKSCQSSGESSSITTSSSSSSNSKDQYLKHLNRISHKISKPIIRKPPFDHHPNHNLQHQQPPPPPPPPPPLPPSQPQNLQQQQQQQQQHQPPVYNINKSDFRDVVQKLTGSPAHERFATPPPIHPPKPPSSRLQRIRPPPLAQISNRPPPLLNNAIPTPPLPPPTTVTSTINPNNPINATTAANSTGYNNIQRHVTPLSPLPPFPTVHAAAESPVSAYMRYLQNSMSAIDSDPKRFAGFSPLAPLVSPRWSNPTPPQPQQVPPPPPPPQQQQGIFPSPTAMNPSESQFLMPSSPLPFGCLPSPRSPYPLLSPSLLFSPTGQLGFPQFPLSPRLPVPSPRWRDL